MPSSPIGAADDRVVDATLLRVLSKVPDPRDPRGVRYPLVGVLALAVCAVLSGARSLAAIGDWARALDGVQLGRLGLEHAPVESTIRKLFARVDGAALDAALAVFAWCQVHDVSDPSGLRRVIAIDGKSVRGARSGTGTAPHLLAALDHASGMVLGQSQVDAKSNEIPALRDLVAAFDPSDLRGCVITADAMHTQDETAKAIVAAGAHYIFTVKANRPKLAAALKALPWSQIPTGSRSTEHSHGRTATRTIKVIDVPALPHWPEFTGAAQVAQLRRTVTKAGKKSVETAYLITSATRQVAPPAVLASWVRGHWCVENKLHWVRDVTFDEDASRVRTGHTPRIMAALRNTAINLLRLAGWDNIAAALRHHSHNPAKAITQVLTC